MPDPGRIAGADVHPTARVHPGAELAGGVVVGPYAVIEADVVIGEGTVVGPHSVIHAHVTLGRRNRLAAHVVIGGRPQDRAYRGEPTRIVIGDDNLFSEFSSVDRATGEGHQTRIGNSAYIMSFAKVSHNCNIGDGANIVSGVQLGGWVHVGAHAYVGGLVGVHQFVHIGRLAMIAGMTGVAQDVPPYIMVAGFRGRAVGLNTVGLRRHGASAADRQALQRAFKTFFMSGLPLAAAIEQLDAQAQESPYVLEFVNFIRAARARNRGIVRWQSETEL
ncbi:MAG: acyl-ACP--UDP-N-acetylglucosamine O-acyltransferase [Armatimonadota bacterium]|nr:acyl-ACP--UDP-N-acetylglucosamine O-acyltransferase [Armatimonadota bacterium]